MPITVAYEPSAATYGTIQTRVGEFQRKREDFLREDQQQQQFDMATYQSELQSRERQANLDAQLEYNKKLTQFKDENELAKQQKETERLKSLGFGQEEPIENREYEFKNPADEKLYADYQAQKTKLDNLVQTGELSDKEYAYATNINNSRIETIKSRGTPVKTNEEKIKSLMTPITRPDGSNVTDFFAMDQNGVPKLVYSTEKVAEAEKKRIQKDKMEIYRQASDLVKSKIDIWKDLNKVKSAGDPDIYTKWLEENPEPDPETLMLSYQSSLTKAYNAANDISDLEEHNANTQIENEKKIEATQQFINQNFVEPIQNDPNIPDIAKEVLSKSLSSIPEMMSKGLLPNIKSEQDVSTYAQKLTQKVMSNPEIQKTIQNNQEKQFSDFTENQVNSLKNYYDKTGLPKRIIDKTKEFIDEFVKENPEATKPAWEEFKRELRSRVENMYYFQKGKNTLKSSILE